MWCALIGAAAAENATELHNRALEQAQRGEWHEAVETAQKSLDLVQSAGPHHLLAQIYLVHSHAD